MTNSQHLRANGFHIFPVGHKVCFTDVRSGYTSPSYDAETCYAKLMEYIGLHRMATKAEQERVAI
jgi:hypothetical protein